MSSLLSGSTSNGQSFEEKIMTNYLTKQLSPTDIRVMVRKGVMFRLHKDIFCAASSVFNDIVNQTYQRFGNQVSVLIPVEPDVFRVIHKFLYISDLEHEGIKIQDMDHALALMETSELYKIELLEPLIWNKVKLLMNPQNVLKVLEFTRRMTQVSNRFIDLENHALDMICKNAETLIQSEEFCQLGIHDAVRILTMDGLTVSSEHEEFKAAMRWAEAKAERCENKEKWKDYYFNQLLQHIRFQK